MNFVHLIEVVLAFSFMIGIHEGGHFLVMRLCGVEVDEFALGFGPTLFSRKWGRTIFALRLVPLGGFCLPKGGDASGKSVEEMYAKAPEPGDFLFASWWKRVIIALGGPGMNFVSALVILTCLFLIKGEILPLEKPIIGFVPPGSLAEKAGLQSGDHLLKVNGKEIKNLAAVYPDLLPDYGKSSIVTVDRKGKTFDATITRPTKPLNEWAGSNNWFLKLLASIGWSPDPEEEVNLGINEILPPIVTTVLGQPARNAGIQDGDEILSVNGQKISDWNYLAYLVHNSKEETLQIDFLRDKKILHVAVKPIFNGSFRVIGVTPPENKEEPEVTKVSIFKAFDDSLNFTVNFSRTYLSAISKLVTGKIALKDSLSGPVTIMRLMYHQASQGLTDFLNIVAIISLVLGIMNLLPIPMFDGGQIFIFLIEGIKRSPVSVKFQMGYQQVGLVFVIGLVILVVFNDFKSIFLEIHNHIH